MLQLLIVIGRALSLALRRDRELVLENLPWRQQLTALKRTTARAHTCKTFCEIAAPVRKPRMPRVLRAKTNSNTGSLQFTILFSATKAMRAKEPIDAVRALDLAVQMWCPGANVDVPDVALLEMPVEP